MRPSYWLAFAFPPLYFVRRKRWDLVVLYSLMYALLLVPIAAMVARGEPLGALLLVSIVGAVGLGHARYDAGAPPAPPPVPVRRRVLEGLMMLGVYLVASMALVPLEMIRASAALETSRIEEARWDAEWIVDQAMRYGRAEGQRVGDVADLRRRLPLAHIEATDPWGRDWVVAPAFGNVGASSDDVWVCSRGPEASGECPPRDVAAVARIADGSVGFSARLGGWSSPPPASWGQVAAGAIAVSLIVGPPAAYIASRMIRRRRGRPAPALRGGLALVAFLLILGWPSVPGLALFNSVLARARQANASVEVRAIAAAITEYRRHTGALPAALADLHGQVTNLQGLAAGPFLAKAPIPRGRASYVYRRGIDGTFSVRYRDPESPAVVARAP